MQTKLTFEQEDSSSFMTQEILPPIQPADFSLDYSPSIAELSRGIAEALGTYGL